MHIQYMAQITQARGKLGTDKTQWANCECYG